MTRTAETDTDRMRVARAVRHLQALDVADLVATVQMPRLPTVRLPRPRADVLDGWTARTPPARHTVRRARRRWLTFGVAVGAATATLVYAAFAVMWVYALGGLS